jgi:hypothetical protein
MPHQFSSKRRRLSILIILAFIVTSIPAISAIGRAGDAEYTGTLEPELTAKREDMDQVTFRPVRDLSKLKTPKPLEPGGSITAGRLYHPPSDPS